MNILEMLEREDIYGILESTMHQYYQEVWHKDIHARVTKKTFGRGLVIYPRLGIVVSRFPSWGVMKQTYSTFNVQGNIFKKILAWSYISLCFLTFGLFAGAVLILSDYSVWSRGTVIIPGNRKLKIFRHDKGYVDSILKVGFNDYYFNKELEVRKKPRFDFILGVLEYGERWYREALLTGRCLVRVSPARYNSYLTRVISDLSLFYECYTKEIVVGPYINRLAEEYKNKLKLIEDAKHIKCGDKIRRVIDFVIEKYGASKEAILTTLTHGDLQTGNVFLDEKTDGLYIIDWETVKEKSIWYDSATILCETRRKDKFSSMINSRYNPDTQLRILHFDTSTHRDMNIVASVLILEELGFFLDEIIDLPGDMGSEIIERYEHEIDHIDWSSFR